MKTLSKGALALALGAVPVLALAAVPASAQINAGAKAPEASLPFTMTQVASFNLPWRIAFLPDGRMLVTEKVGPVWLVTQKGEKTPVANAPAVLYGGQGGMLGVYVSPHYAQDHSVYLTYSEPHDGGSSLALAKARLALTGGKASLEGLKVIWRDGAGGKGGQFGAAVAFAPDGKSLFLASGERMRFTPAQDPNSRLGKILHLTLDGKPAPGNPWAGKLGTPTVQVLTTSLVALPSTMPSLPRTTSRSAGSVGSETIVMGQRSATSRGDLAGRAWRSSSGFSASSRLSWTTSSSPPSKSCPAMGSPILPMPMNPVAMTSSANA